MKQTETKTFGASVANLGGAPVGTMDAGLVGAPSETENHAESMELDAVNGGDTLLTVHRIASRLFQAGAFDKATMRHFDELCLTPIKEMGARDIKELREVAGVSQAVLARILNVTVSTIGQWERGEKKPNGSALKLLALMRSKGVGTIL